MPVQLAQCSSASTEGSKIFSGSRPWWFENAHLNISIRFCFFTFFFFLTLILWGILFCFSLICWFRLIIFFLSRNHVLQPFCPFLGEIFGLMKVRHQCQRSPWPIFCECMRKFVRGQTSHNTLSLHSLKFRNFLSQISLHLFSSMSSSSLCLELAQIFAIHSLLLWGAP